MEEVVELLADVEHERWSRWMRWLYENGTWNSDGSFTVCAEKAQRWRQLASTHYLDLDEPTKEYDRVEVRKSLAVLSAAGILLPMTYEAE